MKCIVQNFNKVKKCKSISFEIKDYFFKLYLIMNYKVNKF